MAGAKYRVSRPDAGCPGGGGSGETGAETAGTAVSIPLEPGVPAGIFGLIPAGPPRAGSNADQSGLGRWLLGVGCWKFVSHFVIRRERFVGSCLPIAQRQP